MDLEAEVIKVRDELTRIDLSYLEASPKEKKEKLAKLQKLATRVVEDDRHS